MMDIWRISSLLGEWKAMHTHMIYAPRIIMSPRGYMSDISFLMFGIAAYICTAFQPN